MTKSWLPLRVKSWKNDNYRVAGSANGRPQGSEPWYPGSNPGPAATVRDIKMNIFKKLNPYLTFLLVVGVFEIILIFPKSIYLVLSIFVYFFLSLYYLNGRRFFRKNFWLQFLLAALLLLSGFTFLYFLETAFIKQILIILLAFSYWLFLKNVNLIVFSSEAGEGEKNFINYLCLVISFLSYSSLFALRIFLSIRIIWLELIVLPIILLLLAEVFLAYDIGIKKNILFIGVISLIILELFWANTNLPTNFFVNGIFLAVAYYLAVNLSRHQISNSLSKKLLVRYLTVGSLMLIFVLATAQWF